MQQSITLFDDGMGQPAPGGVPEGLPLLPEQTYLPDAYRLPDGLARGPNMASTPRVVFIEVTNRCNLLCETCPRTYFTREPLKSLSYDEFLHIAEQFPEMRRCTLHGIGEPLLNRALPRMIAYLKARGVEVLFNSNGALLTSAWQEALVRSELDEFRCSIDGAQPATYARIRGADVLHKVIRGLEGLAKTKARLGATAPRVSIWCVATRENLAELPDLVRLAARLAVPEVYLQRMVFFASEPEAQYGMAREALADFRHGPGRSRRNHRDVRSGQCATGRGVPRLGRSRWPRTAWPHSGRPRLRRGAPACVPGRPPMSPPTATACRAASRRSPPTTTKA